MMKIYFNNLLSSEFKSTLLLQKQIEIDMRKQNVAQELCEQEDAMQLLVGATTDAQF